MVSTFQVKSEGMKEMWMKGYHPPGGSSHPPQPQGDHLQGEYQRLTGVCHQTEGGQLTCRGGRHLHLLITINKEQRIFQEDLPGIGGEEVL